MPGPPSVLAQLAAGALVCPVSHEPLKVEGEWLVSEGAGRRYPLRRGVPHLLADAALEGHYAAQAGGAMVAEYGAAPRPGWRQRLDAFLAGGGDHRHPAAVAAFEAVVTAPPPGALCLCVGGGPRRVHPRLVNVNIGAFDNVDVVADAYQLPYADACVDAVHCEAVLEHLELPERAVVEMHRVLKPGAQVFAATPFLQAFHAYPNHFQNFTRVGHDRLFTRSGFEILASGACVGPTFALTDLAALYLRHYLPGRLLGRIGQRAAALAGRIVRPLDRLLHGRSETELLASTVFLHGRKPPTDSLS